MPEPITRTILERFDVPDSAYETVVMLVEMEPQVNSRAAHASGLRLRLSAGRQSDGD